MLCHLRFKQNGIKILLLVCLVTVLGFVNVTLAFESVEVKKPWAFTLDTDNQENTYIGLPSGRSLWDVKGYTYAVEAKWTDRENDKPRIYHQRANGTWNHATYVTGGKKWYDGGWEIPVNNATSDYLHKGKVGIGIFIVDEWGDNSDVQVWNAKVTWYFKYPKLTIDTTKIDFGDVYACLYVF